MSSGAGGEVALREVVDADLEVFYEHQRDADAARIAAVPSRERDAFLEHWRRIRADETVVIRTVVAGGQVVGNVLTFAKDGRREVGYWLGRSHWGRGIASRALALFLEGLDERPLYAYVARGNSASIRVLEKCGFAALEEDESGRVLILRR